LNQNLSNRPRGACNATRPSLFAAANEAAPAVSTSKQKGKRDAGDDSCNGLPLILSRAHDGGREKSALEMHRVVEADAERVNCQKSVGIK
jgi:hypothetical protein